MSAPPFSPDRFLALASARGLALGQPLERVQQSGSTMDLAHAAARRGAPHGTLVLTEVQTAGRGRHGRPWHSRPGESLTFSLLLRPRLPAARAPLLALAVGLAARAAVAERVAGTTQLKWPNDVLVNGRKIAGLLIEGRARGAQLSVAVVGVGLNIGAGGIPASLADRATSLALAGSRDCDREAWLVDFLTELTPRLASLETDVDSTLVEEFATHDALWERALAIDGVHGVGAGITPSGALLIRDAAGRLTPIAAGTVILSEDPGDDAAPPSESPAPPRKRPRGR